MTVRISEPVRSQEPHYQVLGGVLCDSNNKSISDPNYNERKQEVSQQTSSGEMMSLKFKRSSSSGKLISHVLGKFNSLMSERKRPEILISHQRLITATKETLFFPSSFT